MINFSIIECEFKYTFEFKKYVYLRKNLAMYQGLSLNIIYCLSNDKISDQNLYIPQFSFIELFTTDTV